MNLFLGWRAVQKKIWIFFSGTGAEMAFLRSFMFIKFINSTIRTVFDGLAVFLPGFYELHVGL